MPNVILSIDPGKSGAIAAIKGGKIMLLKLAPTISSGRGKKLDITEMNKIIESLKKDHDLKAYIEKVHSMPKQGVASSFAFGKGYGYWIGLLAAHKIPFIEITPQAWKKKALAGTDKSKGAAILRVKQMFPDIDMKPGRRVKDHDGMADAVLIGIAGAMETWN